MDFILNAPLWLQVPLVTVIVVPLVAVAAVALVRLVDVLSLALGRAWRATAGTERAED